MPSSPIVNDKSTVCLLSVRLLPTILCDAIPLYLVDWKGWTRHGMNIQHVSGH